MNRRIALVTPEWPGFGSCFGVGAYVHDLAGLLVGAGLGVDVLAVTDRGRLHWRDGAVVDATIRRLPAALRAGDGAGWLSGRLDACGAQVAEYPNWGGLGAFTRDPCPRLVRWSTPVSTIPAGRWSGLARPWHHHLEAATVAGATAVVANSTAMAATGLRVYGRPADGIIPHAYLGPRDDPAADGRDVLFVGRLDGRKGVDVLLAAWPVVRRTHPQAILHLVGRDREGLAPAARQVAGVVVHGQLPDGDLRTLRRRCAIQVIPSRFESFGLVVLEAWAHGQAVVAHAGGALGEVVGAGGVVVPLLEPGPLAQALADELADPAGRAGRLARGRELLASRYDPRAWLAANLAIYERIARGT